MIKNKRNLIMLFFAGAILISLVATQVGAAEISLTLSKKTDFARIDFGPVSSPAYTLMWAGDVLAGSEKIGEFSATIAKINYGSNGSIISYDITIPTGDTVPEFISVRTNRVGAGAASTDKGVIYAASPGFSVFIGLPVYMNDDVMKIVF